jgi:hypothetical protein
MANGMPVLPRLELRRWLVLSTSSMLRMGEAAEPGLCARCDTDGLSARRLEPFLPSSRATTSFISSSRAASRDAILICEYVECAGSLHDASQLRALGCGSRDLVDDLVNELCLECWLSGGVSLAGYNAIHAILRGDRSLRSSTVLA